MTRKRCCRRCETVVVNFCNRSTDRQFRRGLITTKTDDPSLFYFQPKSIQSVSSINMMISMVEDWLGAVCTTYIIVLQKMKQTN